MGGYMSAKEWLMKRKDQMIISVGLTHQSQTELARLDILIGLVWPEALIHPDQLEVVANMIRATLLADELTTIETFAEARAIATYLNSMT